MYIGDYSFGATVRKRFTTVNTLGVPAALANGAAVVYKDGCSIESSEGVTLTLDFDSRTGLNSLAIDTTANATFYANGSDFSVVLSNGTVGGNSVANYTVAEFSINNRSALRPTVGGRTLNVSAGGNADAVIANAAQGGSATVITGSITGNLTGNVTGNVVGSTGSVTGNVAGSVGSVVAEVNANIAKVNGITVTGNGSSGNTWGPA